MNDAVSSAATSPPPPPPAHEDFSQKLFPCRLALLQHMDHATRAAWRQVNKQARADVCETIRSLSWEPPPPAPAPPRLPKWASNLTDGYATDVSSTSVEGHASHAPAAPPRPLPPPTQLPQALLASCTGLKRLSCEKMPTLHSLQGLPPCLEVLELHYCQVAGSFSDYGQGPSEPEPGNAAMSFAPMYACTALRELSLHGCQDAGQLAGALDALSSLQALTLHDCAWEWDEEPQGLEPLMHSLGSLTSLTQLHFTGHGLGADGAALLRQPLAALTGLLDLDLSDCHLYSDGSTALAPALGALTQLRKLRLHQAEVEGEGYAAVARQLSSLRRLELLDLSWNKVSPEGAQALAASLSTLTALTELRLSISHLGPGGMQAVGPALQALAAVPGGPRLQMLDLRDAQLFQQGALALAPAIRALTSLRELNVMYNYFDDEGERRVQAACDEIPGLVLKGWADEVVADGGSDYDDYGSDWDAEAADYVDEWDGGMYDDWESEEQEWPEEMAAVPF